MNSNDKSKKNGDPVKKFYPEKMSYTLGLSKHYPTLRLEKDAPSSLTEEEAAAMIQILENKDELDFARMKNIYFKGCADSIAYLRKLKLIKAQMD